MHSAFGRLAWLLEFARRPIGEDVRERELGELQGQILAFCVRQAGPHFTSERVRRLAPAMIVQLQREAQVGINSFLSSPHVGWALPRVTQRLVRDPITGVGHFELIGEPEELFPQFAADLVAAEGARIAHCERPGCNKLFVRRKRGAYCSRRCSQYVRTKRYRESHASTAGHKTTPSESRREIAHD